MRTNAIFDLFALHQWETDGGPVFEGADAISATIAEEDSVEFSAGTVAPSKKGCPILRDPRHIKTRGTIMTQHAVICMAELTKLLRFRHRQHEKQNGNGKVAE